MNTYPHLPIAWMGYVTILHRMKYSLSEEGQIMIPFGRAYGALSQTQFAIAESEGRWPRIYALWQSEGCHVL